MRNLWIVSLVVIHLNLSGQVNFPLFSESTKIEQSIVNTQLSIEFERPKINDRVIFGSLVPYGKVWRTGAGKCTTLDFSQDVYINDKLIQKGSYSLFTIPEKEEWTIILNQDTSLYGAYRYDEKKDVVRVDVPSIDLEQAVQAFNIVIDVAHDVANVTLSWSNKSATFRIETRDYDEIKAKVFQFLESEELNSEDRLGLYAEYMIHNRSGFGPEAMELAEKLVDKSLSAKTQSNHDYYTKRTILKIQQRTTEYIQWSKKHIEFLNATKPYDGYNEDIKAIVYEISEMEKAQK